MTERSTVLAEVAQIFLAAGWKAGESFEWDNKFAAPNLLAVGGIDPWGTPRTRAVRGEIAEEAAWLVEHAKQFAPVVLETPATLDPITLAQEPEQVETPGDESDGETGEAFPSVTGDQSGDPLGYEVRDGSESAERRTGPEDGESDDFDPNEPSVPGALESAPLDADFTIEDLGSEDLLTDDDFDVPALEGADLEPEAPADPVAAETPQDRFYGLDDLDRRRSLRIGDVVRISRSLQANVRAEMGDHDFAAIQGAVLRDTVDGVYRGEHATYELFVRLATFQSHITRIQHAEAEKVAFLESASREDVEAFVSEEGWP